MMPVKSFDSSFVLRKGLPYMDFLNHEIGLLRDSGILAHIMKRNEYKKTSCPLEEKTISIRFEKVIFPFSVYILGVLMSLLILIIENLKTYKNNPIEPRIFEEITMELTNTRNVGVQCNLIIEHQFCKLLWKILNKKKISMLVNFCNFPYYNVFLISL